MGEKRVIEQVASNVVHNDDWFLKDSPTQDTSKISATNLKAILGADGTLALEEIANAIAEEYDSTQTYTYNSWVFHEGVLYRCITQSVTGTWDATKWQAKTIKEFIADSENLITSRLRAMFGEYLPISTLDPPSIEAISKGDIFIYQRTNKYKFYRAKADHPQGVTEFDIDDWDEFDTVADLIEDVTENAGKVADVQVKTADDYETVVDNKIAKIDLSSVTAYGSVPNLPQPIATFKDGADAPMKSLKVAIEPQQDLHGYDAPWAGGAGKNKWEFNSSLSGNGNVLSGKVFTNQIPLGTYTLSSKGTFASGGAMAFRFVYTDDTTKDITLGYNVQSGTYYVSEVFEKAVKGLSYVYSNNANNNINSIQLEQGETATSYAPYSNICPISGWDEANVNVSGVNIWDEEWEQGYYDANGDKNNVQNAIRSKNHIPCLPNTTYYIHNGTDSNGRIQFYDASKNWIGTSTGIMNNTVTTPNNCYYINISTGTTYGGTYNNDISINYPSTDTDYHAYNGATYTIDLDGTRYGGTLDVVSGVLTVDRIGVDMATLNWTNSSSNHRSYCYDIKTLIKMPSSQSAKSGCIAEKYFEIPFTGSLIDGEFAVGPNGDMIFYYNGVNPPSGKLVYPLATPLTVQLTPTAVKSLLGQNNIWADTGDITDAEYVRDATATINDILARLEALEG